MIKLTDILKENLNLKSGKVYPEITLNPSNNKLFPNTYEIINEKGDNVGAVQIRNIDGVNNVVNSNYNANKAVSEKHNFNPIKSLAMNVFGDPLLTLENLVDNHAT